LEEFLKRYEDKVLDKHRLLALDIALKATLAIWWGTYKEIIKDWYQCKILLCIRLYTEEMRSTTHKYNGQGAPVEHLEK
jgi:hypothetical protein